MIKLGILTDQENFNLTPDDQHLNTVFNKMSIENEVIVWNKTDWKNYSNILIRTPWDYADHSSLFIEKLKDAQLAGVNVLHKSELILWNMDKSYLKELASRVPVVETIVINNLKLEDIQTSFLELGDELVIKPKIGAGGKDTFRIKKSNFVQTQVQSLLARDVLVQPFIPSIISEGEYSFIFFNETFSHSVLKKAKSGEFRIQDNHGGTVKKYLPTDQEISTISKMLKKLSLNTLYARVDVVRFKETFYLMELELIEPELFFRFSENGQEQFCLAIKENLV